LKTIPSNPFARVTRLLFVFVSLALGGVWLHAQQAAPVAKVGKVSIRFLGTANVSEDVVRANIQAREGQELDGAALDRDIRSLYRTQLFEFVEIKHSEPTADNVVDLVYEVTPKYRVLAVRFEGNERVRDSRLERETKTRANLPLDERLVKEDVEKLREYYQKAGYNQISVYYEIERDRATGFGTVVFNISEGPRVKIRQVRFEGNENIKARRLRKEMETKRYWMFSWLTGSGRFKDEVFEDDLDKLRDFYREEGFLDVEIPVERIVYDYPATGSLVLTVPVIEGRQYKIGEISFVGNELYEQGLLRLLLTQRTGMTFKPSDLDKDVETLENFYGRGGYLETRVRLVRKPNVTTGDIDIEYAIDESEQYSVESVNIEGNSKTKSVVILRELVLGPGDVFNTERMNVSKNRLDNTRFFEDVNMTPEVTNIPGRRNLKVVVREGRTGNLTFGAGFSSLESAVIFAEVSQSNFDLFNRRSFFQGDGQKFRLRMQLGSRSSEVVLSFEEPWLLERELAVGGQVFRASSDYNSAIYEEIRTGGEIYLRKRLFEWVEGRFSYTYEVVEIANVDPSASPIFQELEGEQRVSKLGFQMLRDTRDKIINTTSGNRAELLTEFAGGPLGGDVNYYKMEFRGSQFLPLFATQSQVLSIIGRLGVVERFGDSANVPFYDRFFLGGPYTLRGFEYRDVGPRDPSGEPLGGKSYGLLSLEYTIDIVSPIRFAIFYDAGFVNQDAYDFSPGRYNDNFGFGLGLFVAGAPLRLDFGIPITTDGTNDEGNQFNFSFGTRF
jgi:outer membrane protein insertion porin family